MSWQENDDIVDQMIKGSSGELWGFRLEQSSHFPLLKAAFDYVGNKGTLLDLGCGAGDVSRTWDGNYTGADLDWVINRVAKVCNPTANYISINAGIDTIGLLPKADTILMNAFLETFENPHEMFESIVKMGFKNIIIHRQKLSNDKFSLESRDSYGNSNILSSIMSLSDIQKCVSTNHPNAQIALAHWDNGYYTMAVRLNEIR